MSRSLARYVSLKNISNIQYSTIFKQTCEFPFLMEPTVGLLMMLFGEIPIFAHYFS